MTLDGGLECVEKTPEIPAGNFVSLCGFGDKFCALRDTGTVVCFGSSTPLPDLPGVYRALDCSAGALCGLTLAGDVRCKLYGNGDTALLSGPFVRVSGGCGIHGDCRVECPARTWSCMTPDWSGDWADLGQKGGLCGIRPTQKVECEARGS